MKKPQLRDNSFPSMELNTRRWEAKLKALLEALEVENIELLMAHGNIETYRKLGLEMTKGFEDLKEQSRSCCELTLELNDSQNWGWDKCLLCSEPLGSLKQ